MTIRTTKTTVTFAQPFRLGAMADSFPAGRYAVETDEELLQGVSFPVYQRRSATLQKIPDVIGPPRQLSAVIVLSDPAQLDLALATDALAIGQAAQNEHRRGEKNDATDSRLAEDAP